MKYTKQERLEIGRKIHESGLSSLKAASIFGISEESARRYRIMYEESIGVNHKLEKAATQSDVRAVYGDYSSMSKDELIEELMKARVREARLKKGYRVKGDGADKEYFLLDSKNTK